MRQRETADELRTKIDNYKQTRRTAAPSMHRWLDALIADTAARLHLMAYPDGGVPPAAPASRAPSASSALTVEARSTYPFDERAPRQRIHA